MEDAVTISAGQKVSVCIPVYNGSDYIAESIQSVLEQTYRDFELIVCDNCSSDNTPDIVKSFHDPRLTYVRNERNLGLSGNESRCLELANGEYICIFHHDDVMLPDNLERKVKLLDEHPEVGFVHSNITVIDSKGEVVSWNIWNEDSRRDYVDDGLTVFSRYLAYSPLGASIFIGAVLARRDCYNHFGGFSERLPHCSDSEMWMRMLLFYKVACIGAPLVKYRIHSTSTSSSWGDYRSINYIKEHYLAVNMVFDKYGKHIPRANNLKRQVSLSFATRLMDLACGALVNRDFDAGKSFFKVAVGISPWILRKLSFWKVAAGLTFGPGGIRIYQAAKKNLVRK
jgi:glycosyltransferase involved in cell wall biosynthesis